VARLGDSHRARQKLPPAATTDVSEKSGSSTRVSNQRDLSYGRTGDVSGTNKAGVSFFPVLSVSPAATPRHYVVLFREGTAVARGNDAHGEVLGETCALTVDREATSPKKKNRLSVLGSTVPACMHSMEGHFGCLHGAVRMAIMLRNHPLCHCCSAVIA
jgi:hypothetical protein